MQEEKIVTEQSDEIKNEEQTQEDEKKLNRQQRRAIKSKRGGKSQNSEGSNKNHQNRITEKPKARRR